MTAPDGTVLGVVDTAAPVTLAELATLLAFVHGGACTAWEAADDAALELLVTAAVRHHAV